MRAERVVTRAERTWSRVSLRARSALANPTVDGLALVLVAGVLLDFGTTTVIFLDPTYEEGNEFLVKAAAVHVSLALAYNLGYGSMLVAAYVFVGGWLGRVGAAMAAPSMFLGVNNLLYFTAGEPTLLQAFFGDAVSWVLSVGIPIFGFVVGSAWQVASERALPWRRVVAVTGVWFAGFGLETVLL